MTGPRWLALAASPCFAVMALVSAADPMAMMCSVPGGWPIGGMTMMYALMSVFHAAPWLGLVQWGSGPARTQ